LEDTRVFATYIYKDMTARASYHFAGKTILITGGAGDIGRASAKRFAADS
jgi:FlaA1/EpsC-like NDP-sugar epimerase